MTTKLLLVEDVEDLGRSGDIVSVKDGYARNYLIPEGFALFVDNRAMKHILNKQSTLQEERLKRATVDKEESEKLASILDEIVLTKIVKVDEEGHMYGSVTAQDIIHDLQTLHNIQLEKRVILLTHPIKEIGVHTILIKLKEGVRTKKGPQLKVMTEEDAKKLENQPEQ